MKRAAKAKRINLAIIGTGWPGPHETDSFELQLPNFIDAISGRARAVNDATLALQLMELIDAIDASSSLGREVPIV